MNERQLELITEKYGKLIHKIGHWISGDNAIASHEDNTQDIWIAAMEAIRGYAKKENQTFVQFWGTVREPRSRRSILLQGGLWMWLAMRKSSR